MKERLIELSTYFYQGKLKEGMDLFMPVVGEAATDASLAETLSFVFDAIEKKDYVMAADILYYEMAMKVEES